ncbi:accessory gene regulator ArgB-like protein [Paenibacillus wenxiniae]|uniref:Accessory gene regulator ArgB-like protein n=1 Tax=Paenibacillus wenxiniae TaxID=1636843 RepID=A0ABW4RKR4_9BACL
MIDQLALKAATYIKNQAPADHPTSIAVLKHALAILINMAMIIFVVIVITSMLGTLKLAVISMTCFAVLRQITGGYHLKSGIQCVVVSSLLFIVLPLVAIPDSIIIYFTLISMLLCVIFAPSDIAKQSRIPAKFYPLLKALGVIVVASNLLIGSDIVALSFLAQTLLLIKWRR